MLMNTTFLEDSFLIKWQSRVLPQYCRPAPGGLRGPYGGAQTPHTPIPESFPDFATCFILTIEKNVENTALGLYFL